MGMHLEAELQRCREYRFRSGCAAEKVAGGDERKHRNESKFVLESDGRGGKELSGCGQEDESPWEEQTFRSKLPETDSFMPTSMHQLSVYFAQISLRMLKFTKLLSSFSWFI